MNHESSIGITGRVEVFNKKTGEKLWDCSNMITNGGRQMFAALASANWASDRDHNFYKEYTPAFILIGTDAWSGADYHGDIQSMKAQADTYIPFSSVSRSYDLQHSTNKLVELGGNSVTYQFDYVNLSKDAIEIRELGLFSKNRQMMAYEAIRGTKISADLEMTLVIRWTISFK